MPFHGRRTVVLGECNGSAQEGSSNARAPVPAVDGKARHPPGSGVIAGEHLGEGPVPANAGKAIPGSYPGLSGGAAAGIGDEPGRYHSVRDLLMQRVVIVWRRFRRLRVRTEEKLAPAPRGIFTTPTKHRDEIAPPIGCRGPYLYGHCPTIGPQRACHDPEHARNDLYSGRRRWPRPARPTAQFVSSVWRPPAPCSLGSGSSNASSNTDTPGRTDAAPLVYNRADHPKDRMVSDGLNTDYAHLLIRGSHSGVTHSARSGVW